LLPTDGTSREKTKHPYEEVDDRADAGRCLQSARDRYGADPRQDVRGNPNPSVGMTIGEGERDSPRWARERVSRCCRRIREGNHKSPYSVKAIRPRGGNHEERPIQNDKRKKQILRGASRKTSGDCKEGKAGFLPELGLRFRKVRLGCGGRGEGPGGKTRMTIF